MSFDHKTVVKTHSFDHSKPYTMRCSVCGINSNTSTVDPVI